MGIQKIEQETGHSRTEQRRRPKQGWREDKSTGDKGGSQVEGAIDDQRKYEAKVAIRNNHAGWNTKAQRCISGERRESVKAQGNSISAVLGVQRAKSHENLRENTYTQHHPR